LVYALNAGGAAVTVGGVEYKADRFASGGTPNATTDPIDGTTADTLYQSERYGNVKYEIPVTNSTYSVQLRFVEMYQEAEGNRLFSASVEGQPIFTDMDLYAEAGHDTAYDLIVPGVMVADDKLTIELSASIDNATISAIEVYSNAGGQFVEPPEPEPGEAIPSAGCGTSRSIQNGRININVGGSNRSYILRVPDNYDNNNPYRLVIAYHWLSGNANQVAMGGNGGSTEEPYYGLWPLANNSTIFVAPEGIDAGWANTGGRDLQFTDAILDQIQSGFCIDESRIFATGFSYGAGMSNAVACARADVFRGVALYAGAQLSGCEGGTAPIAYFGAHGISDSVLNISQGRSIRDRIARNNGCSATNAPEPARGSGTHICTSFQGCQDGYPVRWCAFDGDHNPTQKDSGQSRSWVPGEAWEFISQF
jgi:poly(3-hydroxybutyrate) depolymerase